MRITHNLQLHIIKTNKTPSEQVPKLLLEAPAKPINRIGTFLTAKCRHGKQQTSDGCKNLARNPPILEFWRFQY
jgi:hypothetical protein